MELDTKGMKCPMPTIQLGQRIRSIPVGEEIRIFSDDKSFGSNLRAWCQQTGHTLVTINEDDLQNIVAVVRREQNTSDRQV